MAKSPKATPTTPAPDAPPAPVGTIHVAGLVDDAGVQRCERCGKTLAAASEIPFRTEALLERFEDGTLGYFTGAEVGIACESPKLTVGPADA